MATKITPAIVAQAILGRFRGETTEEVAQRLGFKARETFSRLASDIDLDAIELEIRKICTAAANDIPPEVLQLNEEYDERISLATDLLEAEVKKLQADQQEPSEEKPQPCKTCGQIPNQPKPLSPLEKIQILNGTLAGYDKSLLQRQKIKLLQSEAKRNKKQGPAEETSAFGDLLDNA